MDVRGLSGLKINRHVPGLVPDEPVERGAQVVGGYVADGRPVLIVVTAEGRLDAWGLNTCRPVGPFINVINEEA